MAYTFTYKGVKYTIPDSMLSDTGGSWSGTDSKVYNVINMVKYYIDHGKEPDDATMKSLEYQRDYGKYEGNWNDGVDTAGRVGSFRKIVSWMASDKGKEQIKSDNSNIYLDKNGRPTFNEDGEALTVEEQDLVSQDELANQDELVDPYLGYIEEQAAKDTEKQLGLLTAQREASSQSAELAYQQQMLYDQGIKDQFFEQLAQSRLSKQRNGLSDTQIALEELQAMEAQTDQSIMNLAELNATRLASEQQAAADPYQAYLNTMSGNYGQIATAATGTGSVAAGSIYNNYLQAKQTGYKGTIDDFINLNNGK